MMFLLRAIFWLAVVSALMPARKDESASLAASTGKLAGAALAYCRENPEICAETASLGGRTLRIPADFVLQAQKSIPEPSRRPAPL